ncbi:hypothetical protein [Lactiplantibacillus pentosus]|uniref:hypothetical protein n=1 Tax=Lactiplantibacillus pentosus TaxID=1589 RepID=UPI001C1EDD58|nr:hypothetical protein [Lactiplantibacillus pentosus]MBU7464515.1 hypothetical protein [Lactiplantibacillus pentosus]MBU7490219.1 hypothetical protein [Lactiplantibacillus pentosus]MBU7494517.1 hypothetical protein [Lactiplantibacillus pentosus]MBU7520529.1 hypothetical protein [Lactiplantibacillus pentosus]MBU7526181.1 hypothetical protein [Lactiplantibacillus pentosus]
MQLLILGVVAIVVFILEEYVFTASRHFWVGGIAPVLWTILLAYLVLVNAMDLTVREYVLAIIAVIIPYVCWGNGYQRHQQRRRS